ncbi:MAG: radical SAM protein, partial [Clostridia bacterium]|nr:radical SAM protein [Clostridia bacterium]
MTDAFSSCTLCPRKCGVNRHEVAGYCGEKDVMRISRAALHFWEEPCISGTRGSGAIFFCGCALKCSYCQNFDISRSRGGGEISVERLSQIFFELKAKGAHNINLVTPSHFAPLITEAIAKAKAGGFDLPFIWNSSGYESAETIRGLNGFIDIFLPDVKYFRSDTAARYSAAPDYPERALEALAEMVKIAGGAKFDAGGMMTRGVIVRHLVLPSHAEESIELLKYIYNIYSDDIYFSIMNQYT